MRTINIIIAICFLNTISFGQKLKISTGKFKMDDMIKTPFIVHAVGDKEFDEAVKFAFEKYWKISPLKFKAINEANSQKDNIYSFDITSWKGREMGKFSFSKCYFNSPNIKAEVSFDDFKKGNSDEGIDKDFHMMSIKIIPLIMCYAAEVNRVNELGNTKWGGITYNKRESIKYKVKSYNILIQKENIDSKRLTEKPFKQYLAKYEFINSDELNTRIKEQKNTENTALLIFGREEFMMSLSIIDIKTGDLLYHSEEGLGSFTQGRTFSDEVIGKLLKDLED